MVQSLTPYNCTLENSTLYNETICDFLRDYNQIPDGNLTQLANETTAPFAIGIMSILWIVLTTFFAFLPWPNSEHTNRYDPPFFYLLALKYENGIFGSWLPTGYYMAYFFNNAIFLVELIAWLVSGRTFAIWVQVGLWAGMIIGALPWAAMLLYIYYEWPIR